MKRFSVILSALLLLGGCGLSSKEKITVNEMTTNMQAQCIGRHIIDVPQEFELMLGRDYSFMPASVHSESAAMIEPSIQGVGVTPKQFRTAVDARRNQLAAEENMLTKEPLLREVTEIAENAVLIRAYDDGLARDSFRSELHLLVEDAYVVVKEESFDNGYREAEQRILDFSKNIARIRSADSVQKGFCIGPVVLSGEYSFEQAGFTFRNKARPDVVISVDIHTYAEGGPPTLLQRINGPQSLLRIFSYSPKVLRQGKTSAAGMDAEEWLAVFEEEGDRQEHKFMLETMRPKPSATQPLLTLQMTTGQQGSDGEWPTASLSDKEAMAVWDAIVKSIRVRPGAV